MGLACGSILSLSARPRKPYTNGDLDQNEQNALQFNPSSVRPSCASPVARSVEKNEMRFGLGRSTFVPSKRTAIRATNDRN
jgi:hypothetical protein